VLAKKAVSEARDFLAGLHAAFGERRQEILHEREARQGAFDAGALPDFDPATEDLRVGDWQVVSPPEALADRRVEILARPGRQGLLEALKAGAKAVVVDLEDAMPAGRAALEDSRSAVAALTHGTFGAEDLPEVPPPVVLRPRAWHRDDAHALGGGERMAASLVDGGLHVLQTAAAILASGSAPTLMLPKLESVREAQLWDDVLGHCEAELGLAPNSVRAGVTIETLPAAFATDEILHALRGRITHLDVGRRGVIRSFVATVGSRHDKLLPDLGRIVPGMAFLRAVSLLVISRAHTRGTLGLAGISTRCPNAADDMATTDAEEKLRADAERAERNAADFQRH